MVEPTIYIIEGGLKSPSSFLSMDQVLLEGIGHAPGDEIRNSGKEPLGMDRQEKWEQNDKPNFTRHVSVPKVLDSCRYIYIYIYTHHDHDMICKKSFTNHV